MVKDLKELSKFLKLCREQGVESIKFDNVEVFLRPNAPVQVTRAKKGLNLDALVETDDVKIPLPEIDEPDQLTDEQKLFGSSDPSVWKTQ